MKSPLIVRIFYRKAKNNNTCNGLLMVMLPHISIMQSCYTPAQWPPLTRLSHSSAVIIYPTDFGFYLEVRAASRSPLTHSQAVFQLSLFLSVPLVASGYFDSFIFGFIC